MEQDMIMNVRKENEELADLCISIRKALNMIMY